MKKRLLSICGVAVAGLALASCSGNSNISYSEMVVNTPSEKGSAVDTVSVKDVNDWVEEVNISINNKMTFAEIVTALKENSYTNFVGKDTIAYNYSLKTISDYTAENDYTFNEFGFFAKGKENVKAESYTSSETYLKKDLEEDTKNGTYRTYKSSLSYQKSNRSENDMSENSLVKLETKQAKEYKYNETSTETSEDLKYAYYSNQEYAADANAKRTKMSGSSSVISSYYVSGSEKSTEEDYGGKYTAYDPFKEENVSYTIDASYGMNININGTFDNVDVTELFNSNITDLYTTSYELTDKYIILKSDFNFTEEVYTKAYGKATLSSLSSLSLTVDGAKLKEEIDKLMASEYKGSTTSYEVWLKYDESSIAFAYYKCEETTCYNIDKTYEESDFTSTLGYDAETKYTKDYKDLVGKKYVKKGKTTKTIKRSTSDAGYEDKINNLFSECQKDNDYKDLVFVKKLNSYNFEF